MAERRAIIEEANKLTLSYDYDGAIDLIKTYQGKEGGYEVYPALLKAIEDLEAEKDSLLYMEDPIGLLQSLTIFLSSLLDCR